MNSESSKLIRLRPHDSSMIPRLDM